MLNRTFLLSTLAVTSCLMSVGGSDAEAQSFVNGLSTLCGCSPPNWNAPKGAVVASRSEGPVKSVIDAIGEYRTHTILSNGNGWVTHSTRHEPLRGILCTSPLNNKDLEIGYPGWEQTNMGAIYQFTYGGTSPITVNYQHPSLATKTPTGGVGETVRRILDSQGVTGAADWLWDSVGWQWVDGPGFYILGDYASFDGSFNHYYYDFSQYMDGMGRSTDKLVSSVGGTFGNLTGLGGIVCSESPALAYVKWQEGQNPTGGPKPVMPHKYTRQETINAGNALWSAVFNQCMGQTDFWGQLGVPTPGDILNTGPLLGSAYVAATMGCSSFTMCVNASYQVLNCFFDDDSRKGYNAAFCSDSSPTRWSNYVNGVNPLGVPQEGPPAISVSPDALLGWAHSDPSSPGPWARYVDTPLQWSGTGAVCGCWD